MIKLDKEIESIKKNFGTSTRMFYKYLNSMKKKKETEQKEGDLKLSKEFVKNKELDKNNKFENNKKINDENKNNQINSFNFTIKEKQNKPYRFFKSQDNINKYKEDSNEKNKIINNLDIKKDEQIVKNKNNQKSLLMRNKNDNLNVFIIKKRAEKNVEEKSKNNNDKNTNYNIDNIDKSENTFEKFNNKNHKNILINRKKEKLDEIHLNDKFENIENQKNQNLFRRRNKINENNKYINKAESGNKFKKETLIQSIKSSEINSLSQKNTNLFNSHKFHIKNYLIKNSEEINDKDAEIGNNKDYKKPNLKNYEINNNKINQNKEKENKIIIESKKTENKEVNSKQVKSGTEPYFDTYKSSESNIKQKYHHYINILNNNSEYNNKNIKDDKEKTNNLNLPYKLKTENNRLVKREKVKFSPSPKMIKKSNEPPDIIEPKNIDTKKDFPIDDPYIQSNPEIYEEIQNKLKDIIYKVKLPMFNPDFYKIEKKIGEGTHGSIFQVMNIKNGKRYAIKKIFSNDIILLKYIKKEFDLVYEAIHPNILSIYGIFVKCFDSNTFSISVLMDLGETDWEIEINDHLYENKYYSENELMSILKQLVSGLAYLQKEKKIAHRDVKPENVIIFKNNIYKLGDFGEAKGTRRADKLSTLRGTDTYMSPILYKGLKMAKEDVVHDLYKSDVFSLGYSILYAVSLNHNIINEIRDLEKMEDIEKILYKRMKPRYSDNFINIILKMINPEETKRIDFISLDKLINH